MIKVGEVARLVVSITVQVVNGRYAIRNSVSQVGSVFARVTIIKNDSFKALIISVGCQRASSENIVPSEGVTYVDIVGGLSGIILSLPISDIIVVRVLSIQGAEN